MVFFGFSKLIKNITDNPETGEVKNADLSHLKVRKLNPYGALRNTEKPWQDNVEGQFHRNREYHSPFPVFRKLHTGYATAGKLVSQGTR